MDFDRSQWVVAYQAKGICSSQFVFSSLGGSLGLLWQGPSERPQSPAWRCASPQLSVSSLALAAGNQCLACSLGGKEVFPAPALSRCPCVALEQQAGSRRTAGLAQHPAVIACSDKAGLMFSPSLISAKLSSPAG